MGVAITIMNTKNATKNPLSIIIGLRHKLNNGTIRLHCIIPTMIHSMETNVSGLFCGPPLPCTGTKISIAVTQIDAKHMNGTICAMKMVITQL